ncbi:enoyl-CoA hydratase-related protein [Streptomyces sp. NPDC048484]|uniref:enoyl-CoA hydratase-related protein n=1 Tax=Streptomyces sp. NPDC048484 TaxID=3155146 RepID=UPI0034498D5D
MQEPRVRYEKKDRVAGFTVDRPAVLNAMDLCTREEHAKIWNDFEADDEAWGAVLTGAGDRSFSVGQDVRERTRLDWEGAPRSMSGSRG